MLIQKSTALQLLQRYSSISPIPTPGDVISNCNNCNTETHPAAAGKQHSKPIPQTLYVKMRKNMALIEKKIVFLHIKIVAIDRA